MSTYNFVYSEPNFTISFVERQKNRFRQRRLHFVAIFIASRDICAQTQKLS